MNAKGKSIKNPIRIITAAALFDGHDAAINIMRRIIQDGGAEVIHLGHNRSVQEIVQAAIQEDAQAIAISSYQGGHVEFFKYMIDLLKEHQADHIKVFGGGGGVIVQDEIDELEGYGVTKIFSPEDGRRLGLVGMIDQLLQSSDYSIFDASPKPKGLKNALDKDISRAISYAENNVDLIKNLLVSPANPPVLGITGTGGAGKSSLTDELIRRYQLDFPNHRIGILSIDPTRRRTGGALLGDRIRMNAIRSKQCFARSLATREAGAAVSKATQDAIQILKCAHFDFIIVETSGIGQGDSAITDICDLSMYVMTPEYGAPSQLEKIDMLDFADIIALNKFDRRGSEDAIRDVRKQVRRNRKDFNAQAEELPVFGTIAAQFNDTGVNALYLYLLELLSSVSQKPYNSKLSKPSTRATPPKRRIIPPEKANYLREIAGTIRHYHHNTLQEANLASQYGALTTTMGVLPGIESISKKADSTWNELSNASKEIINQWDDKIKRYKSSEFQYQIRGKTISQPLYVESLSRLNIPRIAMPRYRDLGDRIIWSMKENVPGEFPFTAGVFPLKRRGEEPKRMFAGEGGPHKTNSRFHFLCKNESVHRLSTAFDSVTLYGEDPDHRPDIFGKIGESGVSIATLNDMKALYDGFDLCAKTTSVSMTINGPAPILLAMFLNTAIDQQIELAQKQSPHPLTPKDIEDLSNRALNIVRGTVQADILKEDQAQNTCIFSLDFALKMMGDIQAYFIEKDVRNYYSVSISGYHIAEAGANPISQLAFTLSNGFTLVEYYLSRGMNIDDFAPNLSFFFSNGMDPEYTVIGRVARRIWAIAMNKRYGAGIRSQKLKYHIQTSGRSLHAREIQFNDIRTTLQALLALYDNCNSLHTNAYDEAITTPTEESVRRAMAIQKIINHEFGLMKNENTLQGSFIVAELTDLVEEAVLKEFESIDRRGGVLGAMETQYQRSKIQEESMYYEQQKHSGELPLIGINTFLDPQKSTDEWKPPVVELRRSTPEEKTDQIKRLNAFKKEHESHVESALEALKHTAQNGGNIFAELMNVVRVASLGQITEALYEVGGEYRRNM